MGTLKLRLPQGANLTTLSETRQKQARSSTRKIAREDLDSTVTYSEMAKFNLMRSRG